MLLNLRRLSKATGHTSFINSNSIFTTNVNVDFLHHDTENRVDGHVIEAQRELRSVGYGKSHHLLCGIIS